MSASPPISIQLYTLRAEAARDFPAVLARLGEIGYVGVEPAGLHDLSPEQFKKCLDDAGLVVTSAHSQTPIGDSANAILDAQQAIGSDDLVVAFLPPERFQDKDSIQSVADELNAGAEAARARGMRLGYHNHYWEFSSQVDGRSAHAALFDRLDADVFAEVDVYWAKVGGADPVQVVADLGPRARLLHVKDGPADGPKSAMTAVGAGAVDVPGVLAAGTSAEWHIVELDRCDTDMFEAVAASYRYLVGEGLSRGRA